MQITETARIKLVIDGAEAGVNELGKIRNTITDLTKKRDEYTRGTKEWKELNDQIREQNKLYKTVEDRMDVMKMTLPQLINYQKDLVKAIGQGNTEAAERIREVNTRIAEMRAAQRATNQEVEKQPGLWNRAKASFLGYFGAISFDHLIGELKQFAMEGIQKAAAISDSFGTIMKTTGMVKNEVRALNTEVEKIDTRTAHEELMKIGAVGGQIGVAKKEMLGFVEATDMAVVALGDEFSGGTEEVTKELGTMKTLFKETKDLEFGDAIQKIGSAINELGAQGLATGPVIADFTNRMGQLGDLSPQITEVMGLGAAFEELGLTAEISSGGLSNIILTAAKGTEEFAKQIGITHQEFKDLINTNPNEMLLQLAESFRGMGVDELAVKLDNLGIKSQEATKVMSLLRDQTDMVREKQELANKAYTEGISLKKEFSVMNNTEQAQLDKSAKAIEAQQRALGERLLPAYIKWNESKAQGIELLGRYGGSILQFSAALGAVILLKKSYVAAQQLKNAWDLKNIASTGALTLTERAGMILKGQWILATQGQAVASNTLTAAQIRATTAAKTFNAALSSNAIILAAGAVLYGLYEIYELTKKSIEDNNAVKLDHIKVTDEEIIKERQAVTQLEITIDSIKKLKDGTDARKMALSQLIGKYPEYFRGMSVEELNNIKLEEVYRRVNGQIQQKINLMAREKQVSAITDQMTDLKQKLLNEGISANTVSEYMNEIRGGASSAYVLEMQKYEKLTRQLTDAQKGLAIAYKSTAVEELKLLVERTKAGGMLLSEVMKEKNSIVEKYNVSLKTYSNEEILEQQKRESKKKTASVIVENEDKATDAVDKGSQKRTQKNKREAAEFEEIWNEAHEFSLKNKQDFEDAKLRLQERYGTADLRKIKEYEKEKQDAGKETEKLITSGLEIIKKAREKNHDDAEKRLQINTNVINEFYKKQIEDQLFNLRNRAKDAEEAREREEQAIRIYGKNYAQLTKEQMGVINEITKKSLEDRQHMLESATAIMDQVVMSSLDIFSTITDIKLSNAKSNTERTLLEIDKMWNQWMGSLTSVGKAWMKGWADGIVATVAWAAQGVSNWLKQEEMIAKANLEELTKQYEDLINPFKEFMEGSAVNSIESFYKHLLPVKEYIDVTLESLQNLERGQRRSAMSAQELIENELLRAQYINDTYDQAISKEKKYYDVRVKSINDIYNEEVRRINDTYDIKQRLADQEFSAASNAILEGRANSLLGLINNQDTKDSLQNDYKAWLADINQIYSLANTEITEGMSQAAIDAINSAREARESAIAEINQRYIKEIEYAVTSEGQKRQEYSETEKIRIEAEEALDKLKHEKTVADIKRNRDKNEELVAAEKTKNEALLLEETAYNNKVLELTLAKDEAIKKSFEIVKYAVTNGYQEIIGWAQQAYEKGAMTLQQYKEFVAEIDKLRDRVGGESHSVSGSLNSYINDEIRNRGLDSSRNTDSWDPGKVNAYLEWLTGNGMEDSYDARGKFLEYQRNTGRNEDNSRDGRGRGNSGVAGYAEGTEYLQRGDNPPGVDTIPIMANEGERIISTPDNKEIGDYTNKEVVAIVKNHRKLEQLAVEDVTFRSKGLIRSFQTSSIAQTGIPAYNRPVSTSSQAPSYMINTTKMEEYLEAMNVKLDRLEMLNELEEIRKVKEEIRNKPVLSLDKLQREAAADALNSNRSTFQ